MNSKGYCLVLSGGGAKGVYHLGAWQALRELNIKIDAVIGNSVGALIAGFIAQNNYRGLEKLIDTIGIDTFISFPEELVKNGEFTLTRANFKTFIEFRKDVISSRGLNTSPLRKLLYKNLSEQKIRASKRELGIVTYAVSNLKPVEIFIDDMDTGTVLEYLLASATFPGFTATEINDKKYIDGGVHDNMPFFMAKSRGYKKIIVIDISGLGINKKPDFSGTQATYIKNSINMGGVFDFNKKFLTDFKRLGYLDTLKTFGALTGNLYFIQEDPIYEQRLLKILYSPTFQKKLKKLSIITDDSSYNLQLHSLLPETIVHAQAIIYMLADCAASMLGLARVKLYPFSELCSEIQSSQKKVQKDVRHLHTIITRTNRRRILNDLKGMVRSGESLLSRGRTPYYYDQIITEFFKGSLLKLPVSSLEVLHPGIRAGKVFLELLKDATKGARKAKN